MFKVCCSATFHVYELGNRAPYGTFSTPDSRIFIKHFNHLWPPPPPFCATLL